MVWLARGRRSARLAREVERRAPDRRIASPVFFVLVTLLGWLASLPVDFTGGWLVERRFGLTRQTPKAWFGDRLKSLAIALILQPLLLSGAWAVIRRRPNDWWKVLAMLSAPLAVLASYIAPLIFMPMFNRFTPLQDPELEERLRRLADRTGRQPAPAFRVDLSRQSDKPNAFFAGIGGSQRIALSDTLLDRFDHDEIEGVIAHELGHQVHGDIWRLSAFGLASGVALSWTASRILPRAIARTSGTTGVSTLSDPASFPVVALVLTALGIVIAPVQAAFSRRIETRTDVFALDVTQNGEAYARAMTKLAATSLADPDPPRPVVLMLYSHPPIADRIRAARAFCANQ